MLAILSPFLEIFNLISNAAHSVLVISYFIGKGIYCALAELCGVIVTIFEGIGVVLEELWLFVRELHSSINEMITYIETSASRGVGGVLEAFAVFASEMGRFFTNGKLHSKLLASAIGQWIANFLGVIRGGLLLIADSVWFLLTIIPKTLLDVSIYLGDLVVFGIDYTWKTMLSVAQTIIDEIFKYTIAFVVIFVTFKNRRRIYRTLRRWCVQTVRTLIRWAVRIFRFLFVLQSAPRPRHFQRIPQSQPRSSVGPSSPLQARSPLRPSSPLNKSNEANCCVVCRDRPKCVLLLPCKHLCMCEECADFILAMRQAFCPLCRSTVHKQLSVYI